MEKPLKSPKGLKICCCACWYKSQISNINHFRYKKLIKFQFFISIYIQKSTAAWGILNSKSEKLLVAPKDFFSHSKLFSLEIYLLSLWINIAQTIVDYICLVASKLQKRSTATRVNGTLTLLAFACCLQA